MRTVTRERLNPAETAEVLALVDAATAADGVRPLNEHVMLHLRYGGDPQAYAVLAVDEETGAVVGYAHVDPTDPVEGPSGELVVHPAHRRKGYGRGLAGAVLELTGGRLRLWAHGRHDGAERLAAGLGFAKIRTLHQMRRSLFADLPEPVFPDGVRLRVFRPGADEEPWLRLNAKAFATHPEQGAWTSADLGRREGEPWFDPAGFFLAERDGRLVGFHWTKIHGAEGEHGHEPIGEVYVVGVDPDEQGGGLGRALTLAGLAHLRSRGLGQVLLYVDEENGAAVRLYESLGFAVWDTDVMYRR
ncbi:mycothiol synthase [Rhizohabitans arisaemae]|uniref:mycothiol synthase n=1 Tax=Rhizohabitans arisaemae TaxID=2720610 RepID=UPI0024B199EE|nr:mycothiol synthase [Rhizohabitans arisaemae]